MDTLQEDLKPDLLQVPTNLPVTSTMAVATGARILSPAAATTKTATIALVTFDSPLTPISPIPQATAANKAVMALKAAIPPKPCANKKRKSTNLEIDMNFERVKPTCVARFASLFTAHRKLKEELKETIRRHSLISLDAISLDQIAQTPLLFLVPEEVHVAVTSFVQLTLSLASNNQETTVLRGQRNKSYLEFAEKLTNLKDNQQAWLRQQLKQHYNSEHVDQSFKDDTGAALYLSPRFFFNRILVVPHEVN
ncbi:hypothetical protein G6F42_023909 [Rhizopus arrhizus]|nr:hypothetical protein G6F42_023909 [Rhizopus arrhizus]